MAIQTIQVNGEYYKIDYNGLENKPIPDVTAADVGKILQVDSNGKWAAVLIHTAEEETF